MKLSKGKVKKALIIGIDGVPYSLLSTYIQNGCDAKPKKDFESRVYPSPNECVHS